MKKDAKIFVAGHRGLAGSAITRALKKAGYDNLLLFSREQLDLLDQTAVQHFFESERPEYVFLAAAKVGGIQANNTYRAEFIYNNLQIQSNIIHSAWKNQVKRLMFLGSSCIYPRDCLQPMKEEYLLSGTLEPTNEPYAIAKIAGIKMCEAYNHQYGTKFFSVMPTNLYGPHDNFNLETSHVLPALLRKCHEAKMQNEKKWTVWGSGTPKREFLYVDDLASACIHLMEKDHTHSIINIGSGQEVSIFDLAVLIGEVVEFQGDLCFDTSKPDGTPRKLLDSSKLREFGFKHELSLKEGLRKTYEWYVSNAV
jgi:GDP-L-fucose synthase